MLKFDRPKNAIENSADLKVGDEVWQVYGIWPPCMGGNVIIHSPAVKFRDHKDYSDIHISQADLTVFDTRYTDDAIIIVMHFAASGNMLPDKPDNNNYYFRSREDAEAARDFLRAEWEKNPDAIAEAIVERERDRELDRMMDDEMDRHHSYADDDY